MLNNALTRYGKSFGRGRYMLRGLIVAGFLIAVGLSVAGALTHLYQMLAKVPAMLRYDGKTLVHSFGNLAMSFVCGPYIMLQMGWRQERDGTLSLTSALIAAFVAFGWAFITGLILVGAYFAVLELIVVA